MYTAPFGNDRACEILCGLKHFLLFFAPSFTQHLDQVGGITHMIDDVAYWKPSWDETPSAVRLSCPFGCTNATEVFLSVDCLDPNALRSGSGQLGQRSR